MQMGSAVEEPFVNSSIEKGLGLMEVPGLSRFGRSENYFQPPQLFVTLRVVTRKTTGVT